MPTTLTARNPEDLLAAVPVVLGFVPEESVVMLTFGTAQPFHARVDLPPPEDADEVLRLLLDPALRHGVGQVVLVLYADAPRPAEQVGRTLLRGFRAAGIEVVDLVRADGHRWFPLLRGRRGREAGIAYDLTAHPFAAQAVFDGRVTHASRTELAATLVPDPARVAALTSAVHGLADQEVAAPGWVRMTASRHAVERTLPDDDEAARLLTAVAADLDCRDAAWIGLPREEARDHVALWTDLVQRAPDGVGGSAAAVLALVAWLAGQGALAWCAVDRAEDLAPGHSLAALVADLLTAAVPPTSWGERDPSTESA